MKILIACALLVASSVCMGEWNDKPRHQNDNSADRHPASERPVLVPEGMEEMIEAVGETPRKVDSALDGSRQNQLRGLFSKENSGSSGGELPKGEAFTSPF